MEIKIVPSLLSADFADLARCVREAEAGGARYLHFDIMDGRFVPNITFGPIVVRAARPISKAHFIAHLMIYGAEQFIEELAEAGAGSIIVQAEACTHLHRIIQQIRAAGASPGVALNPATSLSAVEYVLGDIDLLLVMTVNPGFGGQEFIESMLTKISDARRMIGLTGRDMDIAVDGGIDFDTCERVVRAGANMLVAGNCIFKSDLGIAQAIRELQACALASAKRVG